MKQFNPKIPAHSMIRTILTLSVVVITLAALISSVSNANYAALIESETACTEFKVTWGLNDHSLTVYLFDLLSLH